ncbi:MAG: TRAP transporter small permease [Desulfobacteraceae bacterium]|nr:TRAP transporter small permease [Desulfobacteraceae bacterium]
MHIILKVLDKTSDFLKIISAISLASMMFLTFIDVVGRKFYYPIFGSVEIVGFLAMITIAAALPYTHKIDGHVGVEILVRLLPEKVQTIISIITQSLSFILFSLATWQMFLYAQDTYKGGEVSMNLGFPIHYLMYLVSFGLLIFSLTLIESIINNIIKLRD